MEDESLADEVIGVEANTKDQLLVAKLGGTRNNRVSTFSDIKDLHHGSEAWLIVADEKKKKAKVSTARRGARTTSTLEKKKRNSGSGGAGATKCPRMLEKLITGSHLHSKEDSEEVGDSSDGPTTPKTTSAAPILVVPIFAAPTPAKHAFSMEFSEMEVVSSDEMGKQPHAAATSVAP
jgi:hypothetical protein